MVALTAAIFVFGVYPRPILDAMRSPRASALTSAAK
jgi:NADH:ubiquinone oxidoreductase subunit 4 (subunit M)